MQNMMPKMENQMSQAIEHKDKVRLWLRILGVSRVIESALREKFRTQFGTTLPRFDVMAALNRYRDGLKMSELSLVLKVSNGNVTVIVDRLVEDGYVDRNPVPGDRRAHCVSLTKAGKQQFMILAKAHEEWVNELLLALSPDDVKMMTGQLKTLRDHLS
jgi:DNA-binding MarR family transcriptional regulator